MFKIKDCSEEILHMLTLKTLWTVSGWFLSNVQGYHTVSPQ